jgi:hypothetical protein
MFPSWLPHEARRAPTRKNQTKLNVEMLEARVLLATHFPAASQSTPLETHQAAHTARPNDQPDHATFVAVKDETPEQADLSAHLPAFEDKQPDRAGSLADSPAFEDNQSDRTGSFADSPAFEDNQHGRFWGWHERPTVDDNPPEQADVPPRPPAVDDNPPGQAEAPPKPSTAISNDNTDPKFDSRIPDTPVTVYESATFVVESPIVSPPLQPARPDEVDDLPSLDVSPKAPAANQGASETGGASVLLADVERVLDSPVTVAQAPTSAPNADVPRTVAAALVAPILNAADIRSARIVADVLFYNLIVAAEAASNLPQLPVAEQVTSGTPSPSKISGATTGAAPVEPQVVEPPVVEATLPWLADLLRPVQEWGVSLSLLPLKKYLPTEVQNRLTPVLTWLFNSPYVRGAVAGLLAVELFRRQMRRPDRRSRTAMEIPEITGPHGM